MAIAVYDRSAPKRALTQSINVDLVVQARELTSNLSAHVEAPFAAFVAEKKSILERNRHELQRATEESTVFVREHGSFADEFSTL
ncbi:type II toxin-antitoxin system CcdA family antitoxin [Luteibacter aegosomaticola]|uniref:type II toxin-antitoxin system CcdA family antitoxin n=1 Tax=Luteibacter aegosomaticola TaxID=2911538 RepID=UPI001FF988F6|nr:type II toxin-antitoxin system CcdA family antitoxin [Luteibacter aegosomaticola]UPG89791.1 type II toxin-antitoxin system CcdA family antitoxin [Luteibacter aegosomaticola]